MMPDRYLLWTAAESPNAPTVQPMTAPTCPHCTTCPPAGLGARSLTSLQLAADRWSGWARRCACAAVPGGRAGSRAKARR